MSNDAPQTPDPSSGTISESIGFIEREQAKINDQISEFSLAVYQLTQRLERLESRLLDLSTKIESEDRGLEPPPHSAGPDIPKNPL